MSFYAQTASSPWKEVASGAGLESSSRIDRPTLGILANDSRPGGSRGRGFLCGLSDARAGHSSSRTMRGSLFLAAHRSEPARARP